MVQAVHIWLLGKDSLQENLPANIHEVSKPEQITEPVNAIIISTPEDDDWLSPLKSLRQNKLFSYIPIFYQGKVPQKYHSLFDGPADKNMLRKIKLIHKRCALICPETFQSTEPEIKLLNYAFSRPDYVIEGYLTSDFPHVYDYPLIRVLFDVAYEFDSWDFLHELSLRNLLKCNELPSIIYICPICENGLLNVRKTCPYCHSANYRQERLIHCFACGRIGSVPEFLREERLMCNNCKAPLRERGVDYEKPRENKLCLQCDNYFADETLKLFCLSCHHTCHVNDLEERHLSSYTISQEGEYLIRGIEKNIYKDFGLYFQIIDYVEFSRILNWQIKLSKRYDSVFFSILNIRFNYEIEFALAKELAFVEKLIGKLFANLRKVIRESDLSTRVDGNLFFLLPMTDEEGGRQLLTRIQRFISTNPIQEGGSELNLQLSVTFSKRIIDTLDQDSEVILENLREKTERQQQFYLRAD